MSSEACIPETCHTPFRDSQNTSLFFVQDEALWPIVDCKFFQRKNQSKTKSIDDKRLKMAMVKDVIKMIHLARGFGYFCGIQPLK